MTPRKRTAFVLSVLCLLAALPWVANDYYTGLIVKIMIYGLFAMSLQLLVGGAGLVSLGHAAFFGAGAYATALLSPESASANFFWLIPCVLLASTAYAAVTGALSLRTRGIYFIMITLAFAQMVYYLVNGIKPLGGDDGLPMTVRDSLPLVGLGNPVVFYLVSLGLLAAFVLFSQRAIRARFGTVLRAAMQNERRVTALGFDVYRYRWLAFTISGAATGLAGALFADFSRIATADSATWLQSGDLLVMLILGGAGTLLGPIFGAAAFVVLQTVLIGLTEHWMIVLGPILIFVVLVGKRGIAGLIAGEDA